jgi:hypothetical protein
MIRSAPASTANAFAPEAGSISGTAAEHTDAKPIPKRPIPANFNRFNFTHYLPVLEF